MVAVVGGPGGPAALLVGEEALLAGTAGAAAVAAVAGDEGEEAEAPVGDEPEEFEFGGELELEGSPLSAVGRPLVAEGSEGSGRTKLSDGFRSVGGLEAGSRRDRAGAKRRPDSVFVAAIASPVACCVEPPDANVLPSAAGVEVMGETSPDRRQRKPPSRSSKRSATEATR